MTRDMDLIRELLLRLEALPLQTGAIVMLTGVEPEIAVAGYSHEQIEYHLHLLKEAGLIESTRSQPMIGIMFRGLSWRGHDFLDSVRSPETWKRAQDRHVECRSPPRHCEGVCKGAGPRKIGTRFEVTDFIQRPEANARPA